MGAVCSPLSLCRKLIDVDLLIMKRSYESLILLAFLITLLGSCKKDPASPQPNYTYDPISYEITFSDQFPILDIPSDNPTTVAGIKLGRMLYYDAELHPDGLHSCASCHVQTNSFTSDGDVLPHLNLGWSSKFLWDGKIQGTLEDIMLFEVRDFFGTDVSRLQHHTDYPRLFFEAFGEEEITQENAANAMAQFQRTMISDNSKYDQVISQKPGVFLTDAELRGYDIFFTERGDCFHCHGGILFTDNLMHNNGLDAQPIAGYGAITSEPFDMGKFKTPTLRNIALTGPYMHDGRYETLEEVLNFYSEGVHFSETIDPLMKFVHQGGIQLTDIEKTDLLAFLYTLTDTSYIEDKNLSSPF